MELKKMRLDELNRAEYNPRRAMTDSERADLENSIRENGYIEPIVVNVKDGKNVVVSGHQRLALLSDLGVEEVDVSVVELDVEDEAALNIALNRIKGDWDAGRLAEMFASIENRTHLGFTNREIEEVLASAQHKLDSMFSKLKEINDPEAYYTCPCCGKKGDRRSFGDWY